MAKPQSKTLLATISLLTKADQQPVSRLLTQSRIKKAQSIDWAFLIHSHSIVAGGFEVTSSTTRLISRHSFVMRVLIFSSNSKGSRYQSAVMASSLATGRKTMG